VVVYILLDEYLLAGSQRRCGPFNVGFLGIVGTLVNGVNLCLSGLVVVKSVEGIYLLVLAGLLFMLGLLSGFCCSLLLEMIFYVLCGFGFCVC
jgi:NADH:ubiquinone oxidoreductase subunit H